MSSKVIWSFIVLGFVFSVGCFGLTFWTMMLSVESLESYVVSKQRPEPIAQSTPPARPPVEELDWNNQQVAWWPYAEGMREAEQKGLPVLYVQYASWCPDCDATAAHFHDPGIVELTRHFVMIRTDVDTAPQDELMRYALDGSYVPKLLFLQPDGTPRHDIYPDPGAFDSDGKYFYKEGFKHELGLQMERALDS